LQNVRFSGPIHPAQIYSGVTFLIILFVAVRVWRNHLDPESSWRDGTFFGLTLFLTSFANGLLEFFRGDAVTIIFSSVRAPQIFSFFLAVVALLFLSFQTHKKFDNLNLENGNLR
jgi:prolipoprotein diacylglyceryltransferase